MTADFLYCHVVLIQSSGHIEQNKFWKFTRIPEIGELLLVSSLHSSTTDKKVYKVEAFVSVARADLRACVELIIFLKEFEGSETTNAFLEVFELPPSPR